MTTYYTISRFAIGSTEGGYWAPDKIISGDTPEDAFKAVLSSLEKEGFSFETEISLCDENGDILGDEDGEDEGEEDEDED